jgi:hypothetical protein
LFIALLVGYGLWFILSKPSRIPGNGIPGV